MPTIKLEEKFSICMDDGTLQNYFGVPFTCVNEEIEENKVLSTWFAEVDKKLAGEMVKARRATIVKD